MKLNQAIITTSLISLNVLLTLTLPLPVQAQNVKQSSKCAATLQSVKNKITKGRKIKVVSISKDNISTEYQNYPKNRSFRYLFVLLGAGAESVLESSKFLTSLTQDVVTSCTDVSQVRFGIAETDYNPTFGLISGNKVGAFKCVDPGGNQKLFWGYVVCI